MALITLTPQMWLLVSLLIENAINAAFDQVSKMTPEEVDAETRVQEERKKRLTAELYKE